MNLKKLLINLKYAVKTAPDIISLKREKITADILIKNNLTIASAESCTGGLISSRLTDVSGSSAYIKQNLITYSNEAKHLLLGVKKETLEKYGAVSKETASEMAEGLLNRYDCSIALSITGIAGPLGSENKPAGLVYISIKNNKTQKIYKYEADPLLYRRLMKYEFSNKAFDYLIDFLKENY